MNSKPVNQHKQMAMGQPVTGMKKGGAVAKKGGIANHKTMPSTMKSTMPNTKKKVKSGK